MAIIRLLFRFIIANILGIITLFLVGGLGVWLAVLLGYDDPYATKASNPAAYYFSEFFIWTSRILSVLVFLWYLLRIRHKPKSED